MAETIEMPEVKANMDLKSAIASKYRPEPEQAAISEVIGDLANKRVAIVLDDMISSGGTVYAIVKKLVEEHGGELSVESEPGKGSVFHIRLPRQGA